MPNTNCLEGMKCPKCGSEEPFWIVVTCFAEVFDDGVNSTEDIDWDDDCACKCRACHFLGEVKDFKEGPQDGK